MAEKKKKSEFIGKGCLIQALGGIFFIGGFFFGPAGIVVGIMLAVILFFYGSAMSQVYYCSDCGNKVEKTAKICPTCKADL